MVIEKKEKIQLYILHKMSEEVAEETAVCSNTRRLSIPYHNKADGFMAALVLTLNQARTSAPSTERAPLFAAPQ